MTLREFAQALANSPKPELEEVVALTVLAVQLREAGVTPTLAELADAASLAAWQASATWTEGHEAKLAQVLDQSEAGRSLLAQAFVREALDSDAL